MLLKRLSGFKKVIRKNPPKIVMQNMYSLLVMDTKVITQDNSSHFNHKVLSAEICLDMTYIKCVG